MSNGRVVMTTNYKVKIIKIVRKKLKLEFSFQRNHKRFNRSTGFVLVVRRPRSSALLGA